MSSGLRVVREIAGEGVGGSCRCLLVSGLPARRSGELGGRVVQGSFRRPGVRRVSAAGRLGPGGLRAWQSAAPGVAGRAAWKKQRRTSRRVGVRKRLPG